MLTDKNTHIDSTYEQLQVITQDRQKKLEDEAREKAILDYNQTILESEQRGQNFLAELMEHLFKDNRIEDAKLAVRDKDARNRFYQEYGMQF